jgi:hypothetical protein
LSGASLWLKFSQLASQVPGITVVFQCAWPQSSYLYFISSAQAAP